MAETDAQDAATHIAPAPPSARSSGTQFQTLQNPLIFMVAAVCGLCLAVSKTALRVIWANAWIIMALLVLSAVAGYFGNDYLEKSDSVYRASGTIRVQLPPVLSDVAHPGPTTDEKSLEIQKATETQRLRSDVLVGELLKDVDNPVRKTTWWTVDCKADGEKARELLSQNLEVDSMPGTQLMKISFTASNKADPAVVITALVDQAMADQREFSLAKLDADHERLADMRNRYTIEYRTAMADVKLQLDDLAKLGGNPIVYVGTGESGTIPSPKQTEITARVNERVALENARIDTDNAFTTMQQYHDRGEILPQVQQMLDTDHDLMAVKDKLNDIAIRLEDAQSQGDHKSPDFDQLTREQELWKKKLDELKDQKTAQYSAACSLQIRTAKQMTDQKLDRCSSEIVRLKADLANLANRTVALRYSEDEVAVYRELIKKYDRALSDLEQLMRQKEPDSMQWFSRPHAPTTREFPVLANTMTMAILGGLSLGVGIAFLRELLKWGRR